MIAHANAAADPRRSLTRIGSASVLSVEWNRHPRSAGSGRRAP
jgi:hypothetical protein